MDQVNALFAQYGYPLLFVLGFVEYIGLPIASVPMLVVGGALSATGDLNLILAGPVVALGGLLADAVWFGLARTRGPRLVDRVCALSSNPRACIGSVTHKVERIGPVYILVSKFLPGTGNLIAAASGLGCVRAGSFLALDAAALGLWAAFYLLLGRVFSSNVALVVDMASGTAQTVTAGAVALIVGAGVWRLVKMRKHARAHHRARVEAAVRSGGVPAVLTLGDVNPSNATRDLPVSG